MLPLFNVDFRLSLDSMMIMRHLIYKALIYLLGEQVGPTDVVQNWYKSRTFSSYLNMEIGMSEFVWN